MADATKFCRDCGAEISERAEICPKCGVRQESHVIREIRGAMAGASSNSHGAWAAAAACENWLYELLHGTDPDTKRIVEELVDELASRD